MTAGELGVESWMATCTRQDKFDRIESRQSPETVHGEDGGAEGFRAKVYRGSNTPLDSGGG
jgi:hypothetical protein